MMGGGGTNKSVQQLTWRKRKQNGKAHKRLQSQGHVRMAYRCSKFNANSLLIWQKEKTLYFILFYGAHF